MISANIPAATLNIEAARYGVVGDGVTDNAATLQAAIDAAPDYSTIILPRGIVGIGASGVHLTSRNGVIIRGPGQIKLLAASTQGSGYGGTKYTVLLTNCYRCTIKGITWNGNAMACGVIEFAGCTECVLDSNEIFGVGLALGAVLSVGANGTVGTYNRFTNNCIHDSSGNSLGMWIGNIQVADLEIGSIITNNLIFNLNMTPIGYTGTGGVISGNYLYNCANGAVLQGGIAIGGSNSATSSNLTISGNVCVKCGGGLHADGPGVTTSAGLMTNTTVSNNVCVGNITSGIGCFNTIGWNVVNNTCADNGTTGIELGGGSLIDFTLTGNVCYDSRSGSSRTQDAGIDLVANTAGHTWTNINISNNVCSNHLSHGIRAQTNSTYVITRLLINGNICCDNGVSGIFSDENTVGSLANTIDGNICQNNTSYDIRADNQDACIGDTNVYETGLYVQYKDLAALSTTPNVYHRKFWRANNASSTAIITLVGLANGREVAILGANANTTFVHNASVIFLKGATNVNLTTGGIIRFRQIDGVIYEIGRSF
jgi:Right handed beta helix region